MRWDTIDQTMLVLGEGSEPGRQLCVVVEEGLFAVEFEQREGTLADVMLQALPYERIS